MNRREKKLREVAFHEAGHAASSFFLGVKIKKASIIPDPERGTLGSVHHPSFGSNLRPDVRVGLKARDTLEKHILIFFAGALAERRVRGRGNWVGARFDHHEATGLAIYLNGSLRSTEQYLAWIHVRAEEMLDRPGYWPVVEAIAAALLEHRELAGDRVVELAGEMVQRWVNMEHARLTAGRTPTSEAPCSN